MSRYIDMNEVDTSNYEQGIYHRDATYYRNSFESGVCSALHYLAKEPTADVVSRDDYNALLAKATGLEAQIEKLTNLLEDVVPASNLDYVNGEVIKIKGEADAPIQRLSELLKSFNECYEHFYNSDLKDKGSKDEYQHYLQKGDELIESKLDLVSTFSKQRGDFLSSDREVAAFAMAYEKVFEAEKAAKKPAHSYTKNSSYSYKEVLKEQFAPLKTSKDKTERE